ncbi:PAS domain S-box protein [Halobaculum rubrum]|uniref:PAS domain S-box protein n=1 Tax=Halobaculum rubrum TaxID=2872158 RepID=UPI001CA3AC70|nr:PAS domain S-box protein [Halobaculum rubrum]QZX99128.1 PAS domain S-box protein [Halobaculum rubrum]
MNSNDRGEGLPDDCLRGVHPREVETIAGLGSWYVDLERNDTEWSEMASEILGFPSDKDSYGHDDVPSLVVSPGKEVVRQERNKVFNGEAFDIEYRIEVEGTTKWIHERAECEHDDGGNPVAANGVLQDITDLKERERELELFRNLVDNACDGVLIVDPDTSAIIDVNGTACRLLGYDHEELVSLSVPDITPAFSMETWNDFAATVRENGTEVIESEHQRKDGSTFPVELRISHVSLEQEYHVATVRDITERKEREQQLEAAHKRYRTLIDAAPDPIFVADADTGELIEANAAAAALRDQPRSEIIGLHQTALHPGEEAERYQELFDDHVEDPDAIGRFDDGEPNYLTTTDGSRVPVSINSSTVSLDDRTLIHGIFRDISEQRRYENALTGINTAAQELLQAETDAEIAQITVETTTGVLDASGCVVYLYDNHSGELAPAAYTEDLDEVLGTLQRIPPGDSVAWRVFTDRKRERFDDIRTSDGGCNAGTPIRSELLIPLGEHGVFLVGDTSVGAFDEMTEKIAGALASTAEAALDRAERTQTLRERERESQVQAERLERIDQLNDEIRTIMQALIQAQCRDAIIRYVCDSLVSLDRFTYAWIGEPDPAASEIGVSARAGAPQNYLDTVSLDLEPGNTIPSVRAARERTTVTVPRIATAPHQTEWRDTALRHGFQSGISVPLVYDEFSYGIMTIYSDQPDTFDDRTESVLTELGELVGYALNTSEQRNALLGGETIDVTFDLTGATDLFVEFADHLSTSILVENIIPRSEETYLVHFQCEDAGSVDVQAVAEELSSVADLRMISEADRTVYEAVVIGDCLVTTLATVGANIRSVVVTGSHCRVRASIREEREKQTLVRHLKTEYPDVNVAIHEQTTTSPSHSWMRLLDDSLTGRQRDILATAYYSGFFDQQRKRTGTEIADLLDISQPAFSTQLRAAHRNLLSTLFGEESEK